MSASRARRVVRVVSVAAAVLLIGTAVVQGMSAGAATTSTAKPKVLTPSQIQASSATQLFAGGLAVQKDSKAASVAFDLTARHETSEAKAITRIASQPVAIWLGDWFTKTQVVKVIDTAVAQADKAGKTPTFVTYAIPDRDCGGYSKGGLTSAQYLAWNTTIADTLRGHRAAVLVEPDSLAMISSCPSVASTRLPLIKSAVTALAGAGVTAYLDAGNSHWVAPNVIAPRLKAAGIASARGFFTNVSNFYPVNDETAFADRVSALTSGAHYVVDVSRNGQGWKGTWCNPKGAGLGKDPAVASGSTRLDATLWVKTPGASDGTCNGGPAAGAWWEAYALALVKLRAR
ncbi:glucanase [Frondihabitans sucicola]|uniref:Glucanase n=1 Tax=Frondihabitans sucicola TaxID=1268041 RepID=A0ABM8GNZ5_9MICO|nr:glycoside hydrolase family 6 protein [Frondihabitans sucicola]BDZ50134.1 glucanase [Frondihabitans sucicola]